MTVFKNIPLRPLIVSAAVAIIIIVQFIYGHLFAPAGVGTEMVIVEFSPGTSFRQVAGTLRDKGLIRSHKGFTWLANFRGTTQKIRAGEYEFSPSMRPLTILEKLEKGVVVKHPVTIPEGYNIREIAALLEAKGMTERDGFIAKAFDRRFVASLEISGESVEGYLFPDTYYLIKGMTDEAIIKGMVLRFRTAFTEELKSRAGVVGMPLKDVVTLASIVEKETGSPLERPLIARVFLNRLRKGMLLQTDPTVIYGIRDFNGNITKKDLMTDTPYNTYRRKGLPPGPIASPGLDSIKAVLYPAEGSYLYFVSRNDGTHHFSKTLEEHNRAVYIHQISAKRKKK